MCPPTSVTRDCVSVHCTDDDLRLLLAQASPLHRSSLLTQFTMEDGTRGTLYSDSTAKLVDLRRRGLAAALRRSEARYCAMDINIEADDFETGEIAREYIVQEVLQTAFDRAYAQLDEQKLQQDIANYTVTTCMGSCIALLEMTFVSREAQPLEPDPLSEASWQAEEQPQPCAQDTWMRGVVPKRWNQQRASTLEPSRKSAVHAPAAALLLTMLLEP